METDVTPVFKDLTTTKNEGQNDNIELAKVLIGGVIIAVALAAVVFMLKSNKK